MAKKSKRRALSRKKELKKERLRHYKNMKSKKLIKKKFKYIDLILKNSNLENNISEEKKKLISEFYKIVDSHTSKGFIKKQKSNRLKSGFSKKLNLISNPTPNSKKHTN